MKLINLLFAYEFNDVYVNVFFFVHILSSSLISVVEKIDHFKTDFTWLVWFQSFRYSIWIKTKKIVLSLQSVQIIECFDKIFN